MDLKHLKEVHAARPFAPFVMHLADGRKKNVTHPELMAFLGNGRTVFWADPVTDRFEFIDLIMIVSAEFVGGGVRSDKRRRAG